MKKYVIMVREVGINGGHKYSHVMGIDEYHKEVIEKGYWSCYDPIFFETKEEADEFLTARENEYVVARCLADGHEGLFIDSALNENLYSSLYDIEFTGTFEECQEVLKELEEEE